MCKAHNTGVSFNFFYKMCKLKGTLGISLIPCEQHSSYMKVPWSFVYG